MSIFPTSTPVTRDGIVYAMGSGRAPNSSVLAVRAGGSGDVTKTDLLWKSRSKVLSSRLESPFLKLKCPRPE